MATIAQLNVRLGLLSKDFEAQLKGVERTLQQTGQKFSRLGADLTAAVSFPLAGLGIAALKSAGDIEALRLALTATMEDAGRSTEDARMELEALRVAALAPGLDFEQAVKASVRLQNVGFSAEKARAVIVELANAVALTGGTAEDLTEVTNQFAQMTGKGKLFQDDLKIILGRMPKLASIMKETFGTTTAEGINALGINARDFIDTVTAKMQELPRVSGGINNAIVNVFTGLKEQAARLGEEINKAFNIESTTGGILDFAKNVVSAFANLDDSTKKLIVSFAGIALVAGPVLSIFGGLVNGATATIRIFRDLSGSVSALSKSFSVMFAAQSAAGAGSGLKFIATDLEFVGKAGAKASTTLNTLTGSVLENTKVQLAATRTQFAKNAITPITTASGPAVAGIGKMSLAFKALGVAQRAALAVGAIGLIVGAIAAAVTIYQSYSREVDKAAKVKAALDSVTRSATDAISAEKVKVTELVGVIKDETASRDEKQRALEALQAIAPKEFANLTIEKDKIYEVDKALDSYIDSLLRAAKAKSAFARLEEIDKLRSALVETADPGIWQSLGNSILSLGNAGAYAALQGTSLGKNFAILKEQLDAEEKAMRDVIKANSDFVDTVADTTDASNDAADASKKKADAAARAGEAAKEAAQKTKLYADALKSIRAVVEKGDVLGSDIMYEQAREIESQIERLIEGGFKPYSKEVENLRNMLKGLREDAAKGFTSSNFAQATLVELDKIENAIGDVNDAFKPIEIDPPLVAPTVEAINKVSDALGKIESPAPLVFKSTTPEVGNVPTLPSLYIPNQVLSIESDPAVAALNAVRDAFIEIGTASVTTEAQTRIAFESYNNGALTATELFQQLANVVYENSAGLAETHAAMAEGITEFSSAIASSLESGTVSFQTFAQAATAAAAKVIGELIRIFVAKLIANSAFSTINPLAAIALAGAAGTIGSALFKRVVGAAKFAEGGVVHGPTLGLVGEYPGAANNPEIIAPENKLTSIFSKELGKSEAKLSKVVNEINTTSVQEKSSTALTNISNAISNLANSVTNNRSDVYDNSSASSTSNSVTNNTYNVFNNTTQGDSEQNTFAQTSQKFAQIKIPAFATGGVIKTPTLGLMGEYANASTNPEIIAPENKLRQIYREESAGAGGGELVAIVKGDDLQFILDRASARRSRTR